MSRTRKIADNVTKNNALITRLEQRGNIKTFSGGSKILQEISFAENGNAGYYSGYDLLPVAAQDVISAAEYNIKQAACPVAISGLEMLQNAGREQMIDLIESRISVAEGTMANLLAGGVYSDGTGTGREAGHRLERRGADHADFRRLWRDRPRDVDVLAVEGDAHRSGHLGERAGVPQHDVGLARARLGSSAT